MAAGKGSSQASNGPFPAVVFSLLFQFAIVSINLAMQGHDGVDGSTHIFQSLMAVILDRKANPPERSYTTTLFRGGIDKIGAKLTEECGEVIEAARETGDAGRAHLVHEAADVLYHLFVLLGHCDIPLSAVEAELGKRFGISGLDEKASRPIKDPAKS